MSGRVRIINLEEGFPTRDQAYQKLEGALARARKDGIAVLKLIHGYGSTGTGGEIRIGVQKRLREMSERGEIRRFIFGENWGKSDEQAWKIVTTQPELKQDRDLGKGNRGITIVEL